MFVAMYVLSGLPAEPAAADEPEAIVETVDQDADVQDEMPDIEE